MKKRYVFLELKIQCGEYQFYSQSLHILPKGKQLNAFVKSYCRDFYGNFAWEDNGNYFFNGGEVAVKENVSTLITETEYNVLQKFV